jgi:putative endonuclease
MTQPNNQETGKAGEDLASQYAESRGFILLHRNWRYRHCEVDIIAHKNNTLHFIEVKTRTSFDFGAPEIRVNKAKLKNLKTAAEAYLHLNPQWKWIQFDILAIVDMPGKQPDIFMIEDVF